MFACWHCQLWMILCLWYWYYDIFKPCLLEWCQIYHFLLFMHYGSLSIVLKVFFFVWENTCIMLYKHDKKQWSCRVILVSEKVRWIRGFKYWANTCVNHFEYVLIHVLIMYFVLKKLQNYIDNICIPKLLWVECPRE